MGKITMNFANSMEETAALDRMKTVCIAFNQIVHAMKRKLTSVQVSKLSLLKKGPDPARCNLKFFQVTTDLSDYAYWSKWLGIFMDANNNKPKKIFRAYFVKSIPLLLELFYVWSCSPPSGLRTGMNRR